MLQPQYSVFGPAIESTWNQPCGTHANSMAEPKTQYCGRNIFFTAPSPLIFFLTFNPTLTVNNYGLKPRNLENYHIFGILWTCPFTWYNPK